MGTEGNAARRGEASWHHLLVLCSLLVLVGASEAPNFHVTRHSAGDVFVRGTDTVGPHSKCTEETCIGLSSGTATAVSEIETCTCRCYPHLPAFREDLRICVDDIHECMLAPFVSGSTSQQIPFVSLPLKGQIVNPNKEIVISGMRAPICAVSGAKFMTEDGWSEVRNATESDVPFRIVRDDARLFLQWIGDSNMRPKLAGRLVIIYMHCKETEIDIFPKNFSTGSIFSPCVAFRVAGTPRKPLSNVSEVAFVTDIRLTNSHSNSDHLSVSEYVTIGISSVLLGLIYVASVFLYLHLRKRNNNRSNSNGKGLSSIPDDRNPEAAEEGIIKNNPLLSMPVHFIQSDNVYSDTTSSDNETAPDIIKHYEERKKQTISAMIHHQQRHQRYISETCLPTFLAEQHHHHQDSSTNECLPEENVSIVETVEGKEDRPDNIRSLTGTTARKKLYFNPAYFEPQLLLAPPPAALEFLSKIREVISMAKQKMAAKRFAPNLVDIPEEEGRCEPPVRPISRQGSAISLKRVNSRRRTCTGCPGCEPAGKLPELPAFLACHNCAVPPPGDSKQNSIRRWLEDVPVPGGVPSAITRTVRAPTRNSIGGSFKERGRHENIYDTVPPGEDRRSLVYLPPPDMVRDCTAEVRKTETERVATLTKRQMNAVINEFTVHRDLVAQHVDDPIVDYEADSLERVKNKSFSPSPDQHSFQPSPSLSVALPDLEEMTMRNAVINKRTISSIPVDPSSSQDDHEYELIVMKRGTVDGYSLVSEVYVNNGFNYGSAPSTPPIGSAYSTLEKKTLKVRYEEGVEKPGKLLIEVEDCADHYIPVHESDSFEPDTLDRKPKKTSSPSETPNNQILLRTTGSFRSDVLRSRELGGDDFEPGNFNRVFGSLREIYEAKNKAGLLLRRKEKGPQSLDDDEKGRILTLEERHSKRQRAKGQAVPPDVIPPPPLDVSQLYQQPKWAVNRSLTEIKSQSPKNGLGRSADKPSKGGLDAHVYSNVGAPGNEDFDLCLLQKSKKDGAITRLIQAEDVLLKRGSNNRFILHQNWRTRGSRPEDSGYLSTDSRAVEAIGSGSETDESLGDGQSESGAESVETHSVFFNRYTAASARPRMFSSSGGFGSIDSGVNGGEHSSSDSEPVSYTTVVPVTANVAYRGNSLA